MREIPTGPALWRELSPVWRTLWDETGEPSAFLSPTWIEEWLAAFGDQMGSRALVWSDDAGRPIGCVVLSRGGGRMGPFPVSRSFVNASGVRGLGCEHNDILVLPDHRERVTDELCDRIRKDRPDQVVLEGVREPLFRTMTASWSSGSWNGYRSEAPYVDLAAIRRSGSDYLSALSSNKRSQIRRSIRKYEERFGSLEFRIASSASEALEWFDELVALHERRWHSVGQSGAFGPTARAFHERLLRRVVGQSEGEGDLSADIVRIRFGDLTVGILYNLVHRHRVHFYQSGLRYHDDPHLKPGLVAHSLAVQHALERGDLEYDFLGGEPEPVRYKRSLSTNRRPLYWAQLPGESLKMSLLEGLRRFKRALSGTS